LFAVRDFCDMVEYFDVMNEMLHCCPLSSSDINYFHGAKFFLSSLYLLTYSRNSPPFMDPQSSLPSSQEPATGPYSVPDESNPHPHTLFKIHFNIIHPSSKWSLLFSYYDQNFYTYLISPMRATCPSSHPL
jgi:hypothetical protein